MTPAPNRWGILPASAGFFLAYLMRMILILINPFWHDVCPSNFRANFLGKIHANSLEKFW
jgi:hypothetical protein